MGIPRAGSAVAVLTFFGVATSSVGPTSATVAATCRPKGAEVVAASSRVVVYAGSTGSYGALFDVYACRIADGRRVQLDGRLGAINEPNAVYRPIRVQRYQVVYVDIVANDQFPSYSSGLNVFDMRQLEERGGGEVIEGECPCWIDVVVRSTGGMAWIRYLTQSGSRYVVRKCDVGCKRPATLAVGERIVPGSLTLRGRRISWLDAGQRRSATLR